MVSAQSSLSDEAAEAAEAQTRMQALYDAHSHAVYRFLLRVTFGERQAAEDLLQETMLRAWRNIDDLNPQTNTLRPWLLTVARRVAIDAGRAKQARPSEVVTFDLSEVPASDDAIDRMLGARAVRGAMAQLSPEHRSVIIELYYRGRSVAETSQLLGIPAGTVKSRSYHALRALRALIGP